jgi:predicted Zn finger-like uncharacterized protein
MFKLVPDQLRISDGWVRCGVCNDVFDAKNCLQEAPVEEWSESLNRTVQGFFPKPAAPPTESEPLAESEPVETSPLSSPEAPCSTVIDDPFFAKSPVELSEFSDIATPNLADSEPLQTVEEISTATDAEPVAPALASPSFMRSSGERTDAKYQRVWLAFSVILGAALFLQLVVNERDRLASTALGLKPMLVSMCNVLGCTVSPLRHIESIAIDSSSFVKMSPDVYRLNLTLKNTHQLELMLPSLELTLTDIYDQPVIRRTMDVHELAIALDPQTISSGGEVTASVQLGIKTPTGTERISGYRLLAFYP